MEGMQGRNAGTKQTNVAGQFSHPPKTGTPLSTDAFGKHADTKMYWLQSVIEISPNLVEQGPAWHQLERLSYEITSYLPNSGL